MKTYQANKNGPVKFLTTGYLVLIAAVFFFSREAFFERTYLYAPVVFPFCLWLWALFHTYYKINNNKLIYRSGYINGEINISNIKEIIKGKPRWLGLKPALATGGIIIKYNRFDDIYLAPISNGELIEDLLKLNGKIIISE